VPALGSHASAALPHRSVLRSFMPCWAARRSHRKGIGYTFESTAQATMVCDREFDWCTDHGHMADRIWAKQAVRRTACYRREWPHAHQRPGQRTPRPGSRGIRPGASLATAHRLLPWRTDPCAALPANPGLPRGVQRSCETTGTSPRWDRLLGARGRPRPTLAV